MNTIMTGLKRKRGFTSCQDMAASSLPISESKDKGKKEEKSPAHLDAQSTPTFCTEWDKLLIKQMFELQSSVVVTYGGHMEDVLGDQNATENSSPTSSLDNEPFSLESYENFKKYDVVEDHSDHLFERQRKGLRRMYECRHLMITERDCLKKRMPDTERIYVRVYEEKVDLLRAVIIGGEGTPYHDGLFFFDVCIPWGYGTPFGQPPLTRYHSAGLRIHPNISESGEVVYNLYKHSSDGRFQEQQLWVPGAPSSDLLQLLVTIRDVFLNKNPFFIELGYIGTPESPDDDAQQKSLLYNEGIIINSLKTMVHVMNKPPKHFEDLVVGHFRIHARPILKKCEAYMEGEFLDGKEEDRCSITFRNDVASCIKPLVEAFMKIGAKEAEEFLHLSDKSFPVPDADDLVS